MAGEAKDKPIDFYIDPSVAEALKDLFPGEAGTIVRDIALEACRKYTSYSKRGNVSDPNNATVQRYKELSEALIPLRAAQRAVAQSAIKEQEILNELKKADEVRANEEERLRSDPLIAMMKQLVHKERLAALQTKPPKPRSRRK